MAFATTEREREYTRSWHAANREKENARARAWHAAHREQRNAYHRARYAADAPRQKSRRRERQMNVSQERYDTMLAAQGGVCAICKQPETVTRHGAVIALSVDHDHACCVGNGRSCGDCVRGLLCLFCNRKVGWLEGHRDIIEAYLARDGRKGYSDG